MSDTTLVEKIHEFAAQAGDTDRVLAQGTVTALQAATAAKQAADANVSNISVSGHTMTVTKGTGEGATDSTITLPDNDTQYIHPAYTTRTGKPTTNQAPAFGGSVTVSQITNDATGHVTGVTDRTITIPNAEATQSSAGLMSAADKTKLDGIVHTTSSVTIYLSKDGSDDNDGLHADSPVLTVARAKLIATSLSTVSTIIFQFGAGDWGTVQIDASCFNAQLIDIRGTANSDTEDTGVMPHFSTLTCWNGMFIIRSIDADNLYFRNVYVYHTQFFKVGKLDLGRTYMQIANNFAIKAVSSQTTGHVIYLSRHSFFSIPGARTVSLEAGITIPVFLRVEGNSYIYFSGTVFTGTYTGKKYEFSSTINYVQTSNFSFPSALPGTTDGTGNYFLNDIPQQGVVLTSGDQFIDGRLQLRHSTNANFGLRLNNSDRDNFTDIRESVVLITDKNSEFIAKLGVVTQSDGCIRNEMSVYDPRSKQFVTGIQLYGHKTFGAFVQTIRLRPNNDNTHPLGEANLRWTQLYAGTSTINTSDERVKSNIASLPDAVLDAWAEVNWQQFQFKDAIESKGVDARLHTGLVAQRILEVFQKHGLDATRYGLLCHDSWEAEDWDETIVDKEAVTETVKVVDKAAVFATRTVEISPAYTDEEGVQHPAETNEETYEVSPEESHDEERVIEPEVSHVEHHHRDAGDLYSLRYEEALCLEAAYQRRRADRMEARLAALEAKVK